MVKLKNCPALFILLMALLGLLVGCGRARFAGRPSSVSHSRLTEPTPEGPACVTNLKNLATALEIWSTDHSGRYPGSLSDLMPSPTPAGSTVKLQCPTSAKDYAYESKAGPDVYTLVCTGDPSAESFPSGFPQYTSAQGLVEK